jgi:DNA polymerase-3 subunit delta'
MAETQVTEILPPRANPELLGQGAAEAELMAAFNGGRLPHAWLICGQGGIGKATLAFRFARYLFAGAGRPAGTMAIDENAPLFRRVAAGGHADLLTVERVMNDASIEQGAARVVAALTRAAESARPAGTAPRHPPG